MNTIIYQMKSLPIRLRMHTAIVNTIKVKMDKSIYNNVGIEDHGDIIYTNLEFILRAMYSLKSSNYRVFNQFDSTRYRIEDNI